jgi:hypothetical protein
VDDAERRAAVIESTAQVQARRMGANTNLEVAAMIYAGLGILYVVLLITLGVFTIRKGHWIMFIVGIFFPLFWFIGALLPPTRAAYERA